MFKEAASSCSIKYSFPWRSACLMSISNCESAEAPVTINALFSFIIVVFCVLCFSFAVLISSSQSQWQLLHRLIRNNAESSAPGRSSDHHPHIFPGGQDISPRIRPSPPPTPNLKNPLSSTSPSPTSADHTSSGSKAAQELQTGRLISASHKGDWPSGNI